MPCYTHKMVIVSYDHRLCDVTSPYVYIYNDSRREFGFSPDQSVFNFCSTATRWGVRGRGHGRPHVGANGVS